MQNRDFQTHSMKSHTCFPRINKRFLEQKMELFTACHQNHREQSGRINAAMKKRISVATSSLHVQ